MRWEEIRSHYPGQWLLVEAVKAHSRASRRILDELAVINVFTNSRDAMQSYAKLHHQNPGREFYVLHTDREKLDIAERNWIGELGIALSLKSIRSFLRAEFME